MFATPVSNHRPAVNRRHAQAGVTLVELMVGIVIGLFLVTGATAIYLAANRLARTQTSGSELQDYGVYSMAQINRGIRRAGYVDWLASTANVSALFAGGFDKALEHADTKKQDPFGVWATANGYGDVTGSSAAIPASATAVFGCDGARFNNSTACVVGGNNSALTVAYQSNAAVGDARNFFPSVQPDALSFNSASDCSGSPPAANAPFVRNQYYVDANNQLMCLGNGGAGPQPIASNVTSFTVRYGVMSPTPGAAETRQSWVTAAGVTNWSQVVAMQVCLEIAGAVGSAPASYDAISCTHDTNVANYKDTRVRKVFRSTISMRNAVFATKTF